MTQFACRQAIPVENRDASMNLFRPRIAAYGWQRHIAPLLLLCACYSNALAEEPQHDFLLFPSVDSFDTFEESHADVEDSFVRPSLNALYSYNGGRFRVLGEYLWSSTESELERLKIGWRAGDNTMWWLGRFFVGDYMLDTLDHAQNLVAYLPFYPRATLGPGQRFLSKGGYVLALV
jgi:hypothetical protein